MNILLINTLFYLLWFIISLKKEVKITIYSFLVLFYLCIAFCGVYSVNTGIYYDTFGFYSLNTLNLEPYIYSVVAYFILFLPFYKIKVNIKNIDFIFTSKTKKFISLWIIVYICYTILKLSEAVISVSTGLAAAYDARHNEGVALFEYNPIISKFNGYSSFFLQATTPFIMLYALFGLKKRYVSQKMAIILISLCFLPSFLGNLGMGSRGGMFMTFFCFLFFIILLHDQLSKNFIHKIYKVAIIFVSCILIYSWAITVDRVGEGAGLNSIIRYFGEAFPNLGWTVWGNAELHPMGERFFPNFFNSYANKLSVGESHLYWQQITGTPILNFKTYFGDLYIEFGTLGAFIFLLFTSIPIWLYFKKKGITIFNIGYLYFYFQLCVFAFSGFTKTGWNSIFELIIISLFVLYLRFTYNQKRNRRI